MKPKVTILPTSHMNATRAAAVLIFTKNTRLNMSAEGFDDTLKRCMDDWDWAMAELEYMAHTIRSSWEFLDITFMINDVSRACAQQITRTRIASYAMQSQRVTDMTGATFHIPDNVEHVAAYSEVMTKHIDDYELALANGIHPEVARGLLPMNVHCNLVAKYNLRTLVDLVSARTSPRVQGEYRSIAEQMRDQTIEMWPWARIFFQPRNKLACDILDELRQAIKDSSIPGPKEHDHLAMLCAKAKDQIEGH